MNSRIIFFSTRCVVSVFSLKDLPPDVRLEIAFCGRSNSGKWSVFNAITRNNKLAKTRKTPGRTRAINIFSIDDQKMNRIADLPGYGFARVSKQTQKEWAKLITAYLNSRQSLRGLVSIMDIRHPFKESDLTLIDWCSETNTPLLIVLNKSDKLSKDKVIKEVEKANLMLKQMNLKGQAIGFSSTKTTGIKELDEKLKRWFDV